MQAIILAGGKGTRLIPITEDFPKPLIKIDNITLLERILQSLPAEIKEILIVIDYKGELIREAFGNVYNDKNIMYILQEPMRGTYGALVSAKNYITSEKFLVMGADDIQDKDALEAMLRHTLSFGVHMQKLPKKNYLIVDIHSGIVRGMRRPTDIEFENLQPMATGIYVFTNDIWNYPPVEVIEGEYGIPQTIRPMLLDYDFKAIEMPHWISINSHQELASAERELKKR